MSDLPPPEIPDAPEDAPPGFRIQHADAVTPPPGGSRHRLVAVAAAAVVAILAAVGLFAATRSDSPPATTTTTESTTSTTQTTVSESVVVARAKGPSIQVAAQPPANWDEEPTAVRYGASTPPSSAEELAAAGEARIPLPNPEYPIEGRRSTPVGWIFDNPTSLGDPFVMLVTEQRGDHLQVQVPVRPNGTLGYVRASEVDLTTIDQRIELDLSDRRLRFLEGDELVAETDVVIGKDETRTPTGRFYVTDQVDRDPDGAFGPRVLATSAYSEQIDEFDGGVPVIAFHGTNQPELIGTQASNGCVRMPNDVVTLIGDRLQLGARVDVSP